MSFLLSFGQYVASANSAPYIDARIRQAQREVVMRDPGNSNGEFLPSRLPAFWNLGALVAMPDNIFPQSSFRFLAAAGKCRCRKRQAMLICEHSQRRNSRARTPDHLLEALSHGQEVRIVVLRGPPTPSHGDLR